MRSIAVVTALALTLSAAPAVADTVPHLPAPSSRQPVGSTSLHLKDTSRPDPWVPSVNARELMVTLFYPTSTRSGPKAQYVTPAESESLLTSSGVTTVPPDLLSRTRIHSVRDARPAGLRHSLPLVVLSPGFTKPRATLTALAEDLASHGNVVALVGHTYEDRATSFPDGRVTPCAACEVDHLPGFWEKLSRGRAADVSFVLDQLTAPRPSWPAAELIDPARIAMGGHSAGGGSTTTTMLADPRIRAGFDIDGRTYIPLPDSGLARPFLFLGKRVGAAPACADPSWKQDWPRLTGWKRWLSVTGAQHASFTDVGLFADQLGVDLGADVRSERVQAITRTYVRAFLDRHLLGRHQPLLERPSPHHPELTFCA
ncbi:alpha/beta hydrolase [Allokutzneria sp. A3M-2-11 16]|uniref:alpha/beta hydrolase family protein n=1 Tax=Allokutzneria sp. A3M-2-11 16 TaxID=2962043 RepID=UPI0020B7C16D|nr:alpha/beta hydrolase [Allokutzneria sp. A3M-2-11 16]MCP3803294.1 alpha/beta hydrolase [Allokutzneria sp. A3M-2-11 16]